MSRGRPLSLSDRQLALVLEAARLLPPHGRARFLGAIADQLLPLDEVDDAAVQAAVLRTVERLLTPVAS